MSTAYTKYSIHHVQHTPSTAFNGVQHTLSTAYTMYHIITKSTVSHSQRVFQRTLHQQNVNRSGSHMQTSNTLPQTSPVLPTDSRCSQAPLELSKVLSDSARAFSGAPESTSSYGGAFRTPRDVTYRIGKFWSSRDLCAGLRET